MDEQPSLPPEDLTIAIAFSGGGYRAAAFNLGVISYLREVTLDTGSLLDKVCALSTVSGGTITGTRYALGVQRGESFRDIYHALYEFLTKKDLVNLTLDKLLKANHWSPERVQSLISAIADVYDEQLFNGALFGELMTERPETHLRHMSFNATEFASALQFRFQWSERIFQLKKNLPDRGLIGNRNIRIPHEVARHIRLADILAASSCFPGAFEPINFPTDFVLSAVPAVTSFKTAPNFPVGLMDGGIVDNQGLEPLLLANDRMMLHRKNVTDKQDQQTCIDLIIASDVASPYMEQFKASIQHKQNWWRGLTPKQILVADGALLLTSFVLLGYFLYLDQIWLAVLFATLSTFFLIILFVGKFLKGQPKKLGVPAHFLSPLGKLLRLNLRVYENMLSNRKDSVMKMMNEVFLKRIRQLVYNNVYHKSEWKNRRIMNAVYELRPGEEKRQEKLQKGELPTYLDPSAAIQEVAQQAASMDTTLWLSPKDVESKMLDAVIACGQFTICWNLLEYIEKVKKDPSNTGATHQKLLSLENQLKLHWEQLQINPYWLFEQYHSPVNIDAG
ncbi:patatin-like phospholipase family protein [Longitalea arenae]|uniref:patatin-like phospholipase family protein n=1 Tax=Longitalea arenae TaxID=2812558 RepID=UPI001966F137|nr:patatin-like phospholipase family protein [Longitalea arenae]